jgi:hypothetical protein
VLTRVYPTMRVWGHGGFRRAVPFFPAIVANYNTMKAEMVRRNVGDDENRRRRRSARLPQQRMASNASRRAAELEASHARPDSRVRVEGGPLVLSPRQADTCPASAAEGSLDGPGELPSCAAVQRRLGQRDALVLYRESIKFRVLPRR